MAASNQMRAAWSRRTDEELLHAHFLEELSPDGMQVVRELMLEKFGPLDAFVAKFAAEQGEIIARIPVRSVDVDAGLADRGVPLMYGLVVLATRGIGFVPGGHDEDLAATELGEAFGGSLGGALGSSMWRDLKQTMHRIEDRSALALPVPLLAEIDPNAVWLAHGSYDAVLWGPDFGEIMREGQRLFSVDAPPDAEAIVSEWGAAHDVEVTPVAPAPLFR